MTKKADKIIDSEKINLESIEKFILDAGSDHVPTFGGNFEGGIQCQQVPDEIAPCILTLIESRETIKSYLEIGVAAGGTTVLFNHFFKPERIVLIDDNKHPKAHVRKYILDGIKRNEFIGNSQDVIFSTSIEGEFDLIIIDADHSYNGVASDFFNYFPKLREGGFLIFHDSQCQECWGVHIFVEELKKDRRLEFINEYVTTKHTRPCGVALFRKVG